MAGHILATGAGKAVMDKPGNPLHDYTLQLTGKERPRIMFIGTASGDEASYIVSFYEAYKVERAQPAHLRLFNISVTEIREYILEQDIIHVGGGNTANMLDVWRRHEVDEALREAWEKGAVMTGGSAGAICWFEGGTTDSYGPELKPLPEGLGFIKGSLCPHYDAEDQRQPLFHRCILDGTLPDGYAVDNLVAVHFEGTELIGGVSAQKSGRALKVYAKEGQIVEESIETTVL